MPGKDPVNLLSVDEQTLSRAGTVNIQRGGVYPGVEVAHIQRDAVVASTLRSAVHLLNQLPCHVVHFEGDLSRLVQSVLQARGLSSWVWSQWVQLELLCGHFLDGNGIRCVRIEVQTDHWRFVGVVPIVSTGAAEWTVNEAGVIVGKL